MKTIEIYRQDNVKINFAIKKENSDGELVALDLTGLDNYIFMTCRKEVDSSDTLYDKAVDIDVAADGECSVSLTRAETLALFDGSDFQSEAGGRAPICELVYRKDEEETTYLQFWLRINEDVRRS